MAVLNMPRTTPPTPPGFSYLQSETQTKLEAEDSLDQLVHLVIAHRIYKGLTPIDYDSVSLDIQRQICSQMPPGICRGEPGEDYKPYTDLTRFLTLAKIEAFSFAAFEWVKTGRHLVDEEQARNRAKICLGCPFNKAVPSCSCTPLWAFIKSLIPPKRQIDNLHICGICGCSLSALTLLPENVVQESHRGRDLTFPNYCWMYDLK